MPVTRRRVLYIPGYDPIPPRRYRELYRREGAEQARIAGYTLNMGARRDRTGFGWGVTGAFPADARHEAGIPQPAMARDARRQSAETAGQPMGDGTLDTAPMAADRAETKGLESTTAENDTAIPDRNGNMAQPTTGRETAASNRPFGKGAVVGPPATSTNADPAPGPAMGAEAASATDKRGTVRPDPGKGQRPAIGHATGRSGLPPGQEAETNPTASTGAADRTGGAMHAQPSRIAAMRPGAGQDETVIRRPAADRPAPQPPVPPHKVEAEMEVLVWSDVVAASMGRSIAATYGQLARTAWIYIASGALAAMMRLRRGPVLAALYPVAVLVAQALLALAAGAALGWAGARILPWWAAPVPAVAGFVAVLVGFRRLDGRLFAHYLMHDYAFTARLRGAYPPELEARIARFADRVEATLKGDWDEVLIVGHSSGAYLAVSVLAELARRQPPDPRLALLTLGHVVPMAAFLPEARRLRGDLARVSASPVAWVDVSAPGDACCFGLCDPVTTCGVEPENRNGPLVLSAAFSQTLAPARLKTLRRRWFRLHFQYLCAFDHPEGYDYFAITAGPLTLAERFAGRRHSPGRIARAVSPFRDRAP